MLPIGQHSKNMMLQINKVINEGSTNRQLKKFSSSADILIEYTLATLDVKFAAVALVTHGVLDGDTREGERECSQRGSSSSSRERKVLIDLSFCFRLCEPFSVSC